MQSNLTIAKETFDEFDDPTDSEPFPRPTETNSAARPTLPWPEGRRLENRDPRTPPHPLVAEPDTDSDDPCVHHGQRETVDGTNVLKKVNSRFYGQN